MSRMQWEIRRAIACVTAGVAAAGAMLWLQDQGPVGRALAVAAGWTAWVGLMIWIVRRPRGT